MGSIGLPQLIVLFLAVLMIDVYFSRRSE